MADGNYSSQGSRQNFDGRPAKEPLFPKELPHSQQQAAHSRNFLMPAVAQELGYELTEYSEDGAGDPYVIHDRFGSIVHQFPDDFEPDFIDIMNACKKLNIL